ncbi:hypothetical protein PQX77_003241 [Marasmius sp. AFHP31]|nr:hypothetical protein PQX77_003241 [Marasmius sp. AFHP31]
MRFATFFVLFSAASVLAIPFKRDVDTVKADFATMDTQLTNLNDAISSFPSSGGTPAQLLAIHSAAFTLDNSVKKTTADIQSTAAFNHDDGKSLIDRFEARFRKTIFFIVRDIRSIGREIKDLEPTPGEILRVIEALDTDFSDLFDAFISKVPSDLEPELTAMKDSIASDFALTIAALSPSN